MMHQSGLLVKNHHGAALYAMCLTNSKWVTP